MKVNATSFFLFFLAAFAPLPIFFDLANFSIVFTENVFLMENKPQIPLPISFVFFVIIFILKFPFIINKLSYKKFNLLLILISLLSFLSIINGLPISRLFQLLIPIILILSLPVLINSVNKYVAYALPISLSIFIILHLIYNFYNIAEVNCDYNCNLIFLGYEIYHGSVGFPEVILYCCSGSLFLSQESNNKANKLFLIILFLIQLCYAFFIGRGATILAFSISIIIFGFITILKTIYNLKMNKGVFICIILSFLLLLFFYMPITDRLNYLSERITQVGENSTRIVLWNYFIKQFTENPLTLIFGGSAKSITGHNSIISTLNLIGIFGLLILLKSYSLAFSQFKKFINFNFSNYNDLQIFSLNIFLVTLIVGNIINDSITQPLNTLTIFTLVIILISSSKKNNYLLSDKNKFI